MIIVKIFQGPGNQLFQYAYGLATANRIGTELKLDLSWFKSNSSHRIFILDRFNLTTQAATPEEVEWVKKCNGKNFFEYRFNLVRNKLASRAQKSIVKEDLSVFDEALLRPYSNAYIEGYFSSEDFFKDSEKLVRSSLTFSYNPSDRCKKLFEKLDESTIALSIRRGDFLKNPLHNVCSQQYFHRAVNQLKQEIEDPNLLIFSDDFEWVEANFKFSIPHTFANRVGDHMDHMRLMSLCRYHIIPNSTFSWWGAWLSEPKVVIAPDIWLSSDKSIHLKQLGSWAETGHTVPRNWIRIPSFLKGERLM